MAFWNNWRNITPYEHERIDLLKRLQASIKEAFPDKIHCILVGGSFPRREYVKDSDVDVWIVMQTDADTTLARSHIKQGFTDDIMKVLEQEPNIYSLESLRKGAFPEKHPLKMSPKRFVLISREFFLLHGKPLPYDELQEMTLKQAIRGMITFILKPKETSLSQRQIAKLYLYLSYFIEKSSKASFPYSFSEMEKLFNQNADTVGKDCLLLVRKQHSDLVLEG